MAKRDPAHDHEFEKQNERAIREAREADRIEPRAHAASYESDLGLILVELRTGVAFGFPPERIPGLEAATAEELANIRISPSGDGLHWDELDVDASLTGLVAETLNLQQWAPRYMGQLRSEAKARAARINGLKGGRPRRSRKSNRRDKEAPGA